MDITSLYTVIPDDEGLRALKHFFDHRTVKEPSSETLLRLAELVLTLNCFSFGGNYYKQTNGVAMGIVAIGQLSNCFYVSQFDAKRTSVQAFVAMLLNLCLKQIKRSWLISVSLQYAMNIGLRILWCNSCHFNISMWMSAITTMH